MTTLLRQLKLHGLLGEKVVTDVRVGRIIAFFTELFDGMEYSILPDYDEASVIFHKGGVFHMEHDFDNDRLWCRHDGYWSFLQSDLSLGYDETQAVVRIMVEKHLKREVGTPNGVLQWYVLEVEKHLKREIGIPRDMDELASKRVEKHLKQLYP